MTGIVETIGAYCGLAAFGFTVFERFLKNRPAAFITTAQAGEKLRPQITVTNTDTRSIILDGIEVIPKVYFVEEGDKSEDILKAKVSGFPCTLIEAGQEKQFYIYTRIKDGIPLEIKPRFVRIVIHWRKGSSTWLPQPPVRTRFSTKRLMDIVTGKRGLIPGTVTTRISANDFPA